MKTIGIIGGIAPGSTIEYYRLLVDLYLRKYPDGNYPSIMINSINLKKMLDLIAAGRLKEVTAFLVEEIGRLEKAGAQIAILASNTPHLVFEEIQRDSPLPLVSIVEAAMETASELGLKKLGLIGTKFTMNGGFYPRVFSRAGIEICLPSSEEQEFIHEKYISELIRMNFLPETRERLTRIIERMKNEDGIEAMILGGTELPLILTDPRAAGIPLLDTTLIHAERVISILD
jgi:aspartate racemase